MKNSPTPTLHFTAPAFPALLLLAGGLAVHAAQSFPLGEVDLSKVEQDWGRPRTNRSVENGPLSIGGQVFTNGLGTHAHSRLLLDVKGQAERFSAKVGVDDEVGEGRGSVQFLVIADGQTRWQSRMLRGADPAEAVEVDLEGVMQLELVVSEGEDDINYDHADWVDARIIMRQGEPTALTPPVEPAVILTPKPSPRPRINGAGVFGVRPGSPFLFTIAASGNRPMTFAADGLPTGLKLDPTTGQITGVLKKEGESTVILHAKNALGSAERRFKIVRGPGIALTPPMGWNSWNCFASAVTAEKVKSAADAMVASGLIQHGWTYINIDDFWEVNPGRKDDPTLQGPERDAEGRILPNPRFPDMKELADYVHSKGLKIGLYSSPGPHTCGGCVGSYQHEALDARSYAEWGFDYLKYDWCSYSRVVTNQTRANYTRPTLMKPYQVMRGALDEAGRDIVFSLCQYGMGDVWEWGADVGGNCWRTTGDIRDTWGSMAGIGFQQAGHEQYAGPGHWNDPDMLVVGMVGWGPNLHPTRLSPNEQYTHISLWCLLAAPLLIGCDMTQLDEFTLSLLTNDEVLELNQDPLGRQAGRIARNGQHEVWAKDMEDGSKAVGLFNRGSAETPVTANWSDLGLAGEQKVRDLWRQQDLGSYRDKFTANVPPHGVALVRIWPVK